MTLDDIRDAVRRCDADTLAANAFRIACGLPKRVAREGKATARVNRYAGAAHLMRQRYGVRM